MLNPQKKWDTILCADINTRSKPMMRKIVSVLIIVILLTSTGLLSLSCSGVPHSQALWERYLALYPEGESKSMQWSSPPKMIIDTSKKYTATLEMDKGNLVIELFAKDVPITVNNFVFLALAGYYNGVTFYRVLPTLVAQTGDRLGTGMGGPGYTIPDEITDHKHVMGAVSMTHSDLPDSNGSQFFICYDDLPGLDGKYSVFGQLIHGADAFMKLTARDPDKNPQYRGDVINRVVITEE
jgi:cyclophilin family peptidyl-prolyl cis-trans isomerase